jgi:glycosyltransferase involved in cell wall biosynthesis
MPRRLRLLWVTPYLPLRGIMAARERWWHLLARLAPRHAVTLLAFVDPEDEGREAELPPGLAAVHRVPKRSFHPDDPLALLPKMVAGGYCDPAFRAAVAARLAGDTWDVVQYEFTEMAHCIPGPAPRSVLTVHQIGFAQDAPAWRAGPRTLRRGAVLLHRYLRELDFELRALSRVDHVVTMSAEDAARLHRFAPDVPISVSPCGVDCHAFRPPDPPPAPDADLLFVGHFGHPPNGDAVGFLVHDVLPRLGRPVRVRVVGRGPVPPLPAEIDVAGAVPDVRPHLAAARVVVAPVRFGTGMRGKVLEALAMGRPVVTTSLGAEGLGAVSGRDLLVADGADGFAGAVRRVLDDPGLGARLGAAGRTLVAARFDWDAIAAAHEDVYDAVVRAPARADLTPEPPHRLADVAGGLGHWPGVGAGFALLLGRALRRHARRLARPAGAALSAAPAAA